jgi:hypothetical protein
MFRPGWLTLRDGIPAETFVIDRVHVDAGGALRWNGAAVDRATLRQHMTAVISQQPRAFVILDPDPRAGCAAVEAAREDMDRSGSCSPGGCGEGHGDWNEGPAVGLDTSRAPYRDLEREVVRAANGAAVDGSR